MMHLLLGLIFAAIFWFLIYSIKIISFWLGISIVSGLLAVWSILSAGPDRRRLFAFKPSYIAWGIVSGVILYIIFWIGGKVSTHLFSFASSQIDAIYSNKNQLPALTTAFLLILIGSSEEIFWRGMAQRVFCRWFGENAGWILAGAAYAAVTILSGNFILVMAALFGGLYWGWLYKRFGSLWPGILSHILWGLAIFLVLPLK